MITENIANNVEAEYLKVEKNEEWYSFFQGIRSECLKNHNYAATEAKKIENKHLNRYRDVSPYDHSRVILTKGQCDYINANLIQMEKAHRKYILTQGPLPNTTGHFWLMVWEQNCKAIIMLNRVIEKNMVKCHQYWPLGGNDDNKTVVFNDVGLKVTHESEVEASYYRTTKLRLEDLSTGDSHEVLHFHYTMWPDFGCPQSPTAFLRFLTLVRNSGALADNVGPPVIHCSAGIGRSGTFCLVDSCLVLIQEMGYHNTVVKDVLLDMRRYRMGLIQTPDQLKFSYLAIIESLKKGDSVNGTLDDCSDEAEVEEDEDSDSEDDDDDDYDDDEDREGEDEPPPLPPPRGESLARSRSINKNVNNLTLPNNDVPVANTNHHHTVVEDRHHRSETKEDTPLVRQRKREREERNAKMEKRVEEVKRKLKDVESWQRFTKLLFHPVSIGSMLVGGGIIFACGFFWTRG